jgi:hypothetical protein
MLPVPGEPSRYDNVGPREEIGLKTSRRVLCIGVRHAPANGQATSPIRNTGSPALPLAAVVFL